MDGAAGVRAPDGPATAMGRRRIACELLVAVAAAVAVLASGLSPTGSPLVDAVVVAAAVAVAAWAARAAPWWLVVAGAAVVAASSVEPVGLLLGALAVASGLGVALVDRRPSALRSVPAALAIVATAHLGSIERFGVSAAIGIGVAVLLAIGGLLALPRRARRIAAVITAAIAALGIAAVVGFALAANAARGPLEAGAESAGDALDEFADGDMDLARASLRDASASFDEASRQLDRPWSRPALLVPGVAQNRRAVGRLLDDAAASLRVVSSVLDRIDLEALRPTNGRVDVDAIAALEAPFVELDATMARLGSTIDAVERDPWVTARVTDRLVGLGADIDAQRERGDDVLRIVRSAPGMLGADDARVYFVAFLTPAELRGAGGVMGDWAEITVDRGQISMTDFGRAEDLDSIAAAAGATIQGPPGWVARWGRYGIIDADGTVSDDVWSNITISPHFPDTAQVIRELYARSGGGEVDGVLSFDVRALATLLQITGAVDVAGVDEPLTAATAEQYLLRDQYLRTGDDVDSADALGSFAQTVVLRLLTLAELPDPNGLVDLFGPLVHEGRIHAWAVRPDERAVFDQAGMGGALPDADALDCATYSLTNAGGNRIDVFLTVESSCERTTDAATGKRTTRATIRLTNAAPTSGLPDSVIGNRVGDPPGTNRVIVSVYGAGSPTSMRVAAAPVSFAAETEHGLGVADRTIAIPAGTTVEMTVEFERSAAPTSTPERLRIAPGSPSSSRRQARSTWSSTS